MDPTTLIIFYATLALGASFLCSILEAVLLSTTHGHIVALKDTHPKISSTWSEFKDDPEGPLTAILTLNTIAHTVGALGVGHQTEAAFGDGDYVIAVSASLLTIAILLLSEILPKTIGALYWRKLTVSSARILRLLMIILLPIVYPIEKLRSIFPSVHNEAVTRDELSHLADIAEETQVIERDEEKVIQNLLGLRERTVASIMTPRVVMATATSDKTSMPVFHEPRTGARSTKLKMKDQKGVWGGSELIHFKPQPGTLIIFPGFLEHEFSVDFGKEPFRFIHWNIQAVPKEMAKDVV